MMVTVTETCSKLYIIEYIVVLWLNDFLVSNTKQQDGSYQIILRLLDPWNGTYTFSRNVGKQLLT